MELPGSGAALAHFLKFFTDFLRFSILGGAAPAKRTVMPLVAQGLDSQVSGDCLRYLILAGALPAKWTFLAVVAQGPDSQVSADSLRLLILGGAAPTKSNCLPQVALGHRMTGFC